MKIEIGKTYEISPHYKKCLFEIEGFVKEETKQSVNTEIMWRSGTFRVTVINNDEAVELQSCLGEDGDVFDFESYEDVEMIDCWDGCAEDYVFYGPNWTDEQQEQLLEDYENDDDGFGMYDFLTSNMGFSATWCNFQIHNGVVAEEVEKTDIVSACYNEYFSDAV